MKQIIRYYSFLVICLLGFASCTDYLDKEPNSDIDATEAYKNFKNFQGFTEELYNCIPLISAHSYHNSINWGEDVLWQSNVTYPMATRIDNGDYWAWSTEGTCWLRDGGNPSDQDRSHKGNLWGLAWYAIHKANLGLAHLNDLTESTTEERNLIEGQLYFFRGWFYFELMQFWGGLPYIEEDLPANTVFNFPRLNYAETAEKAAADFQRAVELLPVDWDDTAVGKETLGNNNLRINKVMALAYLGKNLLWAGSPLMNYESTGNKTYNTDFCKRAADAFAQALKICEQTGRYELAPFESYSDIFYTHNQSKKIPGLKEAILLENLVGSDSRWRWNMVNDFRPAYINSTGVKVYPTANYVDYYGMVNGLPIKDITVKDTESGYDPEYPWKNRDPRFYKDIIYDGVQCCLNSKGNMKEDKQYASLYTGGAFRTANGVSSALTGYCITKFVPQLANSYDGYLNNNVLVLSFMRLSDVYLMYAEATANGYGTPTSTANGFYLTAADAVNKVRDRAGVGHVADKYLGSTSDFMSEVRRERAVELSFEGHRFNDLRRWLLLTDGEYSVKKIVDFDRDPNAAMDYTQPQNAHVLNISESVVVERHFSQKHYWLPLLKSDVNLYPEFKQNPGW